MKLIYISLYLLLLSNVLSNKLLVNNRNQESNFDKINFHLNKDVIKAHGELENHKHIKNFDFETHKEILNKQQFQIENQASLQSNFIMKAEKMQKSTEKNEAQNFDFSIKKENLKQNQIHLDDYKANLSEGILAEKANKNVKNHSENSLFDFSLRKENLSKNQISLENKLETSEKKENNEKLTKEKTSSPLNNVNKAFNNEKNNKDSSFFGANIFTFRLADEHLNDKQFHLSDNLNQSDFINNSLNKEEKLASKRINSESDLNQFNFEMSHEHLNKRQFHPNLIISDKKGNLKEAVDYNNIASKQPSIANMRKESENFDFHFNNESLNKNQFHPQFRIVNNEENSDFYSKNSSKEKANFDFHFINEHLNNKQFHPQIKISGSEVPLRTDSNHALGDSIKIESDKAENYFNFNFNNEHLFKKEFHPQALRIVSEISNHENETNKVMKEINQNFDFNLNSEHLNKKQFNPLEMRTNADEVPLAKETENINKRVESNSENFDFHFNNAHLSKKEFNPTLRIVYELMASNEINNNENTADKDNNIDNKEKNNIETNNQRFDFRLNSEHLNNKQFHPSMRIDSELGLIRNNKNFKEANGLITINSNKIEAPKAKEQKFFDFHFRKESLNKEFYHRAANEEESANKKTEIEKELVLETPLIKPLKARIQSDNFDFHLNHANLNKNEFHPFIEARTEGKKDIKKIKEFFDFHFRKENLNKAQYHQESRENRIAENINLNNNLNNNKFDFSLIHEKLNDKQFHPQVINYAKEQLSLKPHKNIIESNSEMINLAKENKNNNFKFDFRKEQLDNSHFHPLLDQTNNLDNKNNERNESKYRKQNNFDFHLNQENLNNKQFHPVVNRIKEELENKKINEKLENKINFDFAFRKESLNKQQYHPNLNRIINVEKIENKNIHDKQSIENNYLDFSFRKEKLEQKDFHPTIKTEENPKEKDTQIKKVENKAKKSNLRGSKDNNHKELEKFVQAKIVKEENKNEKENKINFDFNEIEFSKEQIMKNPEFLRTFFGVTNSNKKTANINKEETPITNSKNKDKISITINRDVDNSNIFTILKNSTSINDKTEEQKENKNDKEAKNKEEENKKDQNESIKINIVSETPIENGNVNIVSVISDVESHVPVPTVVETPVINLTPIIDVVPVTETVVILDKEKDSQSNAEISIKEDDSQEKIETEKEINNDQNALTENNTELDIDKENKKEDDIVVNEPALDARKGGISFRKSHIYDYLTVAHELEIEF